MNIRPCQSGNDKAGTLTIFDRTFPAAHNFLEAREHTEARLHLEEFLKHTATLMAVGEQGVLGFITVDDEGYIPALYVDSSRLRRGVGSALLNAAQDLHKRLSLHVFAENVPAVRFYQTQGFAVVHEDIQIDASGRRHVRFEMERRS
ncbi:GNAT family N-acetyltransferase [Methylobacterium nigriterrae]|uniref:GNAT family N-acetyltransferase n=1 Tax=Methylobacterium nigriterrae TaxID=3127512 RepID=UPI003013F2BC